MVRGGWKLFLTKEGSHRFFFIKQTNSDHFPYELKATSNGEVVVSQGSVEN